MVLWSFYWRFFFAFKIKGSILDKNELGTILIDKGD